MRFARLCLVLAGAAWIANSAAADYVFADSYEDPITCDGNGCTYCSPLDPTAVCGANSHCLPTQEAKSLCSYPAGTGTSGAACGAFADCAGPLACIDVGMSSQCRQWCQRPSGSCTIGQTCQSLAQPLFIGPVEWGICL